MPHAHRDKVHMAPLAMLACVVALSATGIGLLASRAGAMADEGQSEVQQNKPNKVQEGDMKQEVATFAAGCFWGVEAAFRQVDGVLSTRVGYTGGHTEDPSYKQVCSDSTGHAEAVEVSYDPDVVSYGQLLDVFWKLHNPTTVNRQGPDIGSQYRSAIFYHSPEQQQAAVVSKETLTSEKRFKQPIVTEITPASTFYEAEDYHQKYLEKRGQASCHIP